MGFVLIDIHVHVYLVFSFCWSGNRTEVPAGRADEAAARLQEPEAAAEALTAALAEAGNLENLAS